MDRDPTIEKLRKVGQKYVDSFKGDGKALAADLNRRAEREGRRIISRPPTRVKRDAKKAG